MVGECHHIAPSHPPQAVEELGPVGVLVNSAGVTFPGAFLDTPTLKFQVGGPQVDQWAVPCHAPLCAATVGTVSDQRSGQCARDKGSSATDDEGEAREGGVHLLAGWTVCSVRIFGLQLQQVCPEGTCRVSTDGGEALQCPYQCVLPSGHGHTPAAGGAGDPGRWGRGGCPECSVTMVSICLVVSYLQSSIANEIASSSGVMCPEKVAEDVLNGVQVCACARVCTQCGSIYFPFGWCRGVSSQLLMDLMGFSWAQ